MFLEAKLPDWLHHNLELYLEHIDNPLAIRSSSLLEDSQYQPYAGIYQTYMVPNNDPDISVRLNQLIHAIRLV